MLQYTERRAMWLLFHFELQNIFIILPKSRIKLIMSFERTKSNSLLERRKNIVSDGVGIFNTATVTEAHGAILIDEDGNKLIDFAGGIGVVNAGHSPQVVVDAIARQASKYIHTSFNVVSYEPYLELCEKLVELLPHGEKTKAVLVSTGAEAIENAIKIARQATKRQGVLCFTDAFHGRTLLAISLTSKINYKLDCGPFSPEIYRLPFPNYYRYGNGLTLDEFVKQELHRLEESAHNLVDPKNLAAIIMEPIQGEGGFNLVPQKYLEGLREFCYQHGIMLILDEIQSGFGRTGHWAAWQHYNVQPDISTYAKSMGSGMPIAAVLGNANVMDSCIPGTIGGTYIGNPVCCAAALATIQFMKTQKLNERGREIGEMVMKYFEKLKLRFSNIGDVRGLGAMIAMEFVKNGDPRNPDAELCDRIIKNCANNGLVVISAGTHKNILRILSPLVITNDDLYKGLDILQNAIQNEIKKSI